jgi:hypothetical protein
VKYIVDETDPAFPCVASVPNSDKTGTTYREAKRQLTELIQGRIDFWTGQMTDCRQGRRANVRPAKGRKG